MKDRKIKKSIAEKIGDFTYKITWTVEMLMKRRNLGVKKILELGGWL